jgi:hypothetical protein
MVAIKAIKTSKNLLINGYIYLLYILGFSVF